MKGSAFDFFGREAATSTLVGKLPPPVFLPSVPLSLSTCLSGCLLVHRDGGFWDGPSPPEVTIIPATIIIMTFPDVQSLTIPPFVAMILRCQLYVLTKPRIPDQDLPPVSVGFEKAKYCFIFLCMEPTVGCGLT